MRGLRGHLIAIALALLLQQGAGLAAVAALECCRTAAPRAKPSMSCCKDGGSAHICPLGTSRSRNAPKCRLTGDCRKTDERGLGAALFLLASPAVTPVTLIAPSESVVLRAASDVLPLEQTLSPPTHPPKF